MKPTFLHPVSGKPCSRQRAEQVRNTLNGSCIMHADRAHAKPFIQPIHRTANADSTMTPEYICSLGSCDRPVAEDGDICQTCIELRDDDFVAEFMQAVEAAKPGKPIVDWFQSLMHNGLHAVPQDEDTAGYKRLVFEGPSARLVLNPRRSGDAFSASVSHRTEYGAAEWTVLSDVNVPSSVVLATLQAATHP